MDDVIHKFTLLAANAPPDRLFAELHRLCDAAVGVRLFTCSRFDLVARKAERVYTSDAEAYPLTGQKDIVPNRWTEVVLGGRRPFVSGSIDGLRDVFPDHAKIEALGFGSAINLPVFVSGTLLGTVNLLDINGAYCEDTLKDLGGLSTCAMLAFLSDKLASRIEQ